MPVYKWVKLFHTSKWSNKLLKNKNKKQNREPNFNCYLWQEFWSCFSVELNILKWQILNMCIISTKKCFVIWMRTIVKYAYHRTLQTLQTSSIALSGRCRGKQTYYFKILFWIGDRIQINSSVTLRCEIVWILLVNICVPCLVSMCLFILIVIS